MPITGPRETNNNYDNKTRSLLEVKELKFFGVKFVDGYGNKDAKIVVEAGDKVWVLSNLPLERPAKWFEDAFRNKDKPSVTQLESKPVNTTDVTSEQEDKVDVFDEQNS